MGYLESLVDHEPIETNNIVEAKLLQSNESSCVVVQYEDELVVMKVRNQLASYAQMKEKAAQNH